MTTADKCEGCPLSATCHYSNLDCVNYPQDLKRRGYEDDEEEQV